MPGQRSQGTNMACFHAGLLALMLLITVFIRFFPLFNFMLCFTLLSLWLSVICLECVSVCTFEMALPRAPGLALLDISYDWLWSL